MAPWFSSWFILFSTIVDGNHTHQETVININRSSMMVSYGIHCDPLIGDPLSSKYNVSWQRWAGSWSRSINQEPKCAVQEKTPTLSISSACCEYNHIYIYNHTWSGITWNHGENPSLDPSLAIWGTSLASEQLLNIQLRTSIIWPVRVGPSSECEAAGSAGLVPGVPLLWLPGGSNLPTEISWSSNRSQVWAT